MSDTLQPCPISQMPTANVDAVRVLDTETGAVWRWHEGRWIRVGRYYEVDANLDDAIIRYKRKRP